MRIAWRYVLPIMGLLAFVSESWASIRFDRGFGPEPRRYHWRGATRPDTDPLNSHPIPRKPCTTSEAECEWVLDEIWISPGYFEKSLVLVGLPAFALGGATVWGLSHLGVNEVWRFAIAMPLYLFLWFYLVGWPVDWVLRRRARRIAA